MEPTLPTELAGPTGRSGVVNSISGGWYESCSGALAAYDVPLLEAVEIKPEATVLSLDGGAGGLTLEVARRAFAGRVLGLSPSDELMRLAVASARRADLRNLAFLHANPETYPFAERCFDVQIGRDGACCFANPIDAFGNLASALRPGGRLAFLAWQPAERNEWVSSIAAALGVDHSFPVQRGNLRAPFSFDEPAPLRAVLEAAGLEHVAVTPVEAPMMFGSNVEEAIAFIITGFRWGRRPGRYREPREELAALREDVAGHNDRGVRYGSAAWLVTAVNPRGPESSPNPPV